jgi:hypothetical protein
MKLFKKNPLFGVFVIPIIFDVVGTVLGQPKVYWASRYKVFNEAVPVYPLLQIHPLVFIVFCLGIWLPITYIIVKKLKEPFNVWAAMALFAGHAYNSVNWFRHIQYDMGIFAAKDQVSQAFGLIPMTIYILLIGFIASKSLMIYFPNRKIGVK